MSVSTTQRAVSDYEHLNVKNSKLQGSLFGDDEALESDFLPLKPPKMGMGTALLNTNNNRSNRNTKTDSFFSTKDAPIPVHFSPSVFECSKPSIFLTPQKSQGAKTVSSKENILEPQDVNQIPVPLAWSPGMVLKPTPSLFVTPEKSISKDLHAVKNNFSKKSIELKENIDDLKLRGKHSVRFDLPSISSGEDTFDNTLPYSESPITLKGKELLNDSSLEYSNSEWKSFSPKKSYDPFAYSDDSMLDDSIQDRMSANLKHSPSMSPKYITISSIKSDSNITLEPTNDIPNPKSSRKTLKKTQSTSEHCIRKSISSSKSNNQANSKSAVNVAQSTKKQKSVPKAGPQFLKTDISKYESQPPPKPVVVLEGRSKFTADRVDYSFPFEAQGGNEASEFEHAFARPEFNSTLKVRSEVDKLKSQEVDVEAAVWDTLSKSEMKRTEMNEQASVFTNRLSNQFTNLVNLDTPVESLCDRIVRMRTSKMAGKKKAVPVKKPTSQDMAPDLMEFFSADLQKETPDLSLPGLTPVTSHLVTAPLDLAFDVYRHNRLWNGMNDFLP